VPCEDINTYTTQWFTEHALPSFTTPLRDTALFYTRNMTTAAIRYAAAQTPPLTTIWSVWPCYLYDHRAAPANKMRCIHADPAHRTRFYEAMSRAFALKARGVAAVMHADADYDDPPVDGIWGRVELPAIKTATTVGVVNKLDGLAKRWGVAWRRAVDEALPEGWRERLRSGTGWIAEGVERWSGWRAELKRKRGVESAESCMPLDEYKWFDNIAW